MNDLWVQKHGGMQAPADPGANFAQSIRMEGTHKVGQ